MRLLAKASSPYQEITVYESTELYGTLGKFRWLQFAGDAIQGAMDLMDPNRIVFEYPRAIVRLMQMNRPSFDSAFIIGHGIGTIAGRFPDKRMVTAEIDEKVVELSKTFFHCRGEGVVIGDGRRILEQQKPGAYDYIILDAFGTKGTPPHLTTREFFSMTKEKLNSRGSIIMNLMGRAKNDNLINAIHTTLGEQFSYTKAFMLPGGAAADYRNIIVMGSDNTIHYEAREMAGFREVMLERGHIIMDSGPCFH